VIVHADAEKSSAIALKRLEVTIWRIQLVSGFHLGQIWATISKSLILDDEITNPLH